MGWASRLGRARISASRPQAAGQCDRCGGIFTHATLSFQYDYAGSGLVNKRLLVCNSCNDRPQHQLKAIVLPADPVPIQNPRPADFASQRTDKRITIGPTVNHPFTGLSTSTGDQRTTQDGKDRIVEKNGDDMLAPVLVKRRRITDKYYDRITESRGVNYRITEWMSPVEPAPLPEPEISNPIRVTSKGAQRTTEDDRVREISRRELVLEGRKTSDGKERVTQRNDLRGSLVAKDAPSRKFKRKNDG